MCDRRGHTSCDGPQQLVLQHNKEDTCKAGKQQAHCEQNEYVHVYPLMAQAS